MFTFPLELHSIKCDSIMALAARKQVLFHRRIDENGSVGCIRRCTPYREREIIIVVVIIFFSN